MGISYRYCLTKGTCLIKVTHQNYKMDENFVLTVRSMYERILKETRTILVNIERRYKIFSQQQQSFVAALERCRSFEPGVPGKIKSISQVADYVHHHSIERVDTRICKIFLGLVSDLNDFRRTLERLSAPTNDVSLEWMFSTWKKILDPVQDISHLKEKEPRDCLNRMGVEESRIWLGGIVSVLPIAMDCAKNCYKRLQAVKAYRDQANEYHFVEGLKIEKNKEREERFFAGKYDKPCDKAACNSPLPDRTASRSRSFRAESRTQVVKKSCKSKTTASGDNDIVLGTRMKAFSRPATSTSCVRPPTANSDVRTVISSATASTRSTESSVLSHIKTRLLDPRLQPTHGIDPRPRDDNVANSMSWHPRKMTDSSSMASDQKRLQEAYIKSHRDQKQ